MIVATGRFRACFFAMFVALSLAGCGIGPSRSGEISRMLVVGNSSTTNPNGPPEVVSYSVYPPAPEGFNNTRHGYGRIFVMRPSQFYGGGVAALATVAGHDTIVVTNGGCVTWEQPAGPAEVRFDRALVTGHIVALSANQQGIARLDVQAGDRYYLQLSDSGGRWALKEIPAPQGRKLIAKDFKPVALVAAHRKAH